MFDSLRKILSSKPKTHSIETKIEPYGGINRQYPLSRSVEKRLEVQKGCKICYEIKNSGVRSAKASLAIHQRGSKCTREVVNE